MQQRTIERGLHISPGLKPRYARLPCDRPLIGILFDTHAEEGHVIPLINLFTNKKVDFPANIIPIPPVAGNMRMPHYRFMHHNMQGMCTHDTFLKPATTFEQKRLQTLKAYAQTVFDVILDIHSTSSAIADGPNPHRFLLMHDQPTPLAKGIGGFITKNRLQQSTERKRIRHAFISPPATVAGYFDNIITVELGFDWNNKKDAKREMGYITNLLQYLGHFSLNQFMQLSEKFAFSGYFAGEAILSNGFYDDIPFLARPPEEVYEANPALPPNVRVIAQTPKDVRELFNGIELVAPMPRNGLDVPKAKLLKPTGDPRSSQGPATPS